MDATDVGRALAERHASQAPPDGVDETSSLLNYAEAPRVGDWTLRSALVRLAQPDPVRVAALLQSSRRLDATLHQVIRPLQRHPVDCDLDLVGAGPDAPTPDPGTIPARTYPDVRLADLARHAAATHDEAAVIAGYDSVGPLDPEERRAAPLLVVAVDLERLARRLADWADAGPADPPLVAVEEVAARTWRRLDELGVPEETMPPPGVRSRG